MASPQDQPPPQPDIPSTTTEDQAQGALDRALSMPLVRVFFALMSLLFVWLLAELIINPLLERNWGEFSLKLLVVMTCGLPMLYGMAYAALYGRSCRPWMRKALRGYRPGPRSSAGRRNVTERN